MWAPRPRPEWVSQLNALGRQLGAPASLVPLDEASLLDAARAIAGLDDFGDDAWREPFRVFVQALETEADLHLLGRILARNEIVRCLVNRLQITDTYERHPEIAREQIAAPVLVTGTGRSGTSILHELLAQDPAHRVGRTWELLHPCPPPETATYHTDPRIAAADQEYTFWNLITPEYQSMHENGGDVPNEDPIIDMVEFASDHFMGSYHMRSYAAWLASADLAPVFRAHRRFLQLLQWRCPGDRWVLKAPSYLSKLPALFAEYPEARVVITHRDPLKVLPSIADLMATLVWQHSDSVPYGRIVKSVTRGTAFTLDLIAQMRDGGRLPDDRIVDVRYADLVRDPWATLHSTYERLGLALAPVAELCMREYLAAKSKDRRGAHSYAFVDTGLDLDETRALYEPYMRRYEIPSEV